MNLNLPSDIEKKVDKIIISLPFNKLSIQNMLKNQIPTDSDLKLHGNSAEFRVRPGDGSVNFQQKDSRSGIYWTVSFDFELVDNNHLNFAQLNRFTNQKVAIIIGTSTYIYWIGTTTQLINFSFRETLTGFRVSLSGDVYFPVARKKIQSFRSSF